MHLTNAVRLVLVLPEAVVVEVLVVVPLLPHAAIRTLVASAVIPRIARRVRR
jgi:hypothetical protein